MYVCIVSKSLRREFYKQTSSAYLGQDRFCTGHSGLLLYQPRPNVTRATPLRLITSPDPTGLRRIKD